MSRSGSFDVLLVHPGEHREICIGSLVHPPEVHLADVTRHTVPLRVSPRNRTQSTWYVDARICSLPGLGAGLYDWRQCLTTFRQSVGRVSCLFWKKSSGQRDHIDPSYSELN